MKSLGKRKFMRAAALAVMLIFASQQTGLAKVIDLREEGDLGGSDILLAVLSGYMQAQAVSPSWQASQIFIYTYAIPKATQMVTNTLGIENPILKAGIETALSTGLKTYFDLKLTDKLENIEQNAKVKGDLTAVAAGQSNTLVNAGIGLNTAKVATEQLALNTAAQKAAVNFSAASLWQRAASPLEAASIRAAQGFTYGLTREWLYQSLAPQNKYLASFLGGVGGTLAGEYVGLSLMQNKGITFGIVRDWQGHGLSPVALRLGGDELGKISEDDGTLKLGKFDLETETASDFWRTFKVSTASNAVQTLAAMAGWKEVGIIFSAGISQLLTQGDFLGGVKFGLISALLQKASLATKSPVHGAYFNLFLTSLAKFLLIKDENVFALKDHQAAEELPGPAKDYLVRTSKDLSFFNAVVGASLTQAQVDAWSMGNATPWINPDGTFSFNWNNPDDIFFISRYHQYVKSVNDKSLTSAMVSGMMDQFVSSIHYQSVVNVRDMLSGDIQARYVKTLERPGCQAQQKALAEVEQTAAYTAYADKIKEDSQPKNYLDPFRDPYKASRQVLAELAEKEKAGPLTPQEEKLQQDIQNLLKVYQRDVVAWSSPGQARWMILETSYGRQELAHPSPQVKELSRNIQEENPQPAGNEMVRLDIFRHLPGRSPVYMAGWAKTQPPVAREGEIKPLPPKANLPQPKYAITLPAPLARSSLPQAQRLIPEVEKAAPQPEPLSKPAQLQPRVWVLDHWTQFPQYSQDAAMGSNYYAERGGKIAPLPEYRLVKQVISQGEGRFVNIDGPNRARVEIKAIKDGKEVWLDTGRRVDVSAGRLSWRQRGPTYLFKGTKDLGTDKTTEILIREH